MSTAEVREPLGGVPIREEVGLTSLPPALSLLPVPALSPYCSASPSLTLPKGSSQGKGKKFKSVELGVWLGAAEETEGASGRGFLGTLNWCSQHTMSRQGYPWWPSLF